MEQQEETYEAEKSLLGSIILEPNIINEVLKVVKAEDFQKPVHRAIFSVMDGLHLGGFHTDRVMLWQTLQSKGISSPPEIAEIISFVPSADYWREYADIIVQRAEVKQLQNIGAGLQAASPANIEAVISEARDQIEAIEVREQTGEDYTIVEAVEILSEEGKSLSEGKLPTQPSILTGFTEVDKKCPFHNGELIVLAGRPSMGKTTLALNFAENIIFGDTPSPVLIFSYEMSSEDTLRKMILSHLGLSPQRYKDGYLSESGKAGISRMLDKVRELPLHICDRPLSIDRLIATADSWSDGLVVVDYLQLIEPRRTSTIKNREQEVGDMSDSLKRLALRINCPVLCLAQLNRSVEKRESKRPFMSDLRESGRIEQAADKIFMLYREDYYNRKETTNRAELGVVKQRHGRARFVIPLQFITDDKVKFLSAASDYYDDEVPF